MIVYRNPGRNSRLTCTLALTAQGAILLLDPGWDFCVLVCHPLFYAVSWDSFYPGMPVKATKPFKVTFRNYTRDDYPRQINGICQIN